MLTRSHLDRGDRIPAQWWCHQMETFSALLAFCAGNSLHKGQWRGALMFSLICVWINDWVNNREADDLRRYRGHYDVTVMIKIETFFQVPSAKWQPFCLGPIVFTQFPILGWDIHMVLPEPIPITLVYNTTHQLGFLYRFRTSRRNVDFPITIVFVPIDLKDNFHNRIIEHFFYVRQLQWQSDVCQKWMFSFGSQPQEGLFR